VELWHQILLVVLALLIIFVFGPTSSRMLKNSPKGSRDDWIGLLKPIGLVVLFVIMLIVVARG